MAKVVFLLHQTAIICFNYNNGAAIYFFSIPSASITSYLIQQSLILHTNDYLFYGYTTHADLVEVLGLDLNGNPSFFNSYPNLNSKFWGLHDYSAGSVFYTIMSSSIGTSNVLKVMKIGAPGGAFQKEFSLPLSSNFPTDMEG